MMVVRDGVMKKARMITVDVIKFVATTIVRVRRKAAKAK
jgi:hypothetical protein